MKILNIDQIPKIVRDYGEKYGASLSHTLKGTAVEDIIKYSIICWVNYPKEYGQVAWIFFDISNDRLVFQESKKDIDDIQEELEGLAKVIEEKIAKPAGMDLLYIR